MASAPSSLHIHRLAALLMLGALGACGMPQAPDPAPTAALEPETAPVLLGGAEAETTSASAAPPARRPGWGTMAPIPNPSGSLELASATPPYRLIGPSAPAAEPLLALGLTPPARQTEAAPPARTQGKPRIRHWIVPVRNPG